MQRLKTQLGPSPVVRVSMLVMTLLAILSAFEITPSLPANAGHILLICAIGLVVLATVYWALVFATTLAAGGPRTAARQLSPAVAP